MRTSLWENGALVGALTGAVLRALLTAINLGGEGGVFLLAFCLLSATLGALCGGIAGASRAPLHGAFWGAVLAGLTFAMLVTPIALVAGLFGATGAVETFSLPYLLQRAATGAIAGGLGAVMGARGRARRVEGTA